MISPPFRITHVQGIFSPEHGGPTQSLTNYCQGQVARGHQVSLRVLEGYPNTTPATRLDAPVDMVVSRVDFPSRLGRSAGLRRVLASDRTPDVYHLHGVWLRAMHYAAEEATRRGRPYLVELMGAYEAHPLRQKFLQKWVARQWYQDALLQRAACLHVNSVKEARDLRRLGFRPPIAVVPVGVDTGVIDQRRSRLPPASPWPLLEGRPFLLFLSRIHPKKGLDLLVRAWAGLDPRFGEWLLVIAGSGDPEYVRQCQRMIEELGLRDRCLWVGQVDESQKIWLYQHAGCYVLPSYSENFGNTVAEALAHETPVITTPHTVWTDLPAEGCGWIAETDPQALRDAISTALDLDASERQRMGRSGRRLIEKRYSLKSVLDQLDRVYTWMLGGPRPDNALI